MASHEVGLAEGDPHALARAATAGSPTVRQTSGRPSMRTSSSRITLASASCDALLLQVAQAPVALEQALVLGVGLVGGLEIARRRSELVARIGGLARRASIAASWRWLARSLKRRSGELDHA